jgi:polysaccharide biosynthesis/export protein
MSIGIAFTKAKRKTRQFSIINLLLAFVVGLSTASVSQLSAQDPVQSPTSASPTPLPLPSTEKTGSLINVEDELEVYVFDVPELSRVYTVSSAGMITVPLLPNPIHAAGLTTDQFARALEETFRQTGRLTRPQVMVTIKQSRRSVVAVEGAVKVPQVVAVIGPTKLVSIISRCGGLADDHGSTVTVTRGVLAQHNSAMESESSPSTIVHLKNLMDASDPVSALDVWPGDRVVVERAGIFYVLGEVVRPGGYNLKSADEQVTVLEALAIAGDLTPIAKKNKARIIRKTTGGQGGRQEIALNVNEILSGRSRDQGLQNDDILYIPSSGGKRALRSLSTVPQTVIGGASTAAVYSRF